jgi:hypothetical protein
MPIWKTYIIQVKREKKFKYNAKHVQPKIHPVVWRWAGTVHCTVDNWTSPIALSPSHMKQCPYQYRVIQENRGRVSALSA